MKKRKLQSDSSECKGGGCDAFANVIDDGASVLGLAYSYDALSRPVTRNADTFAYNGRSEVAFAEIAVINRTIDQSEQSNNLAHDADGNLV